MNKAREKILLVRIQQYQDKESFTEIYQAFVEPLYRFIYFKVSDKELAQDLTAEVFLKGWKKLSGETGKDVKHLRAFFYTVARNLVIDYYRSSARQKEVQLREYQGQLVEEGTTSTYKAVEIKIATEQIIEIVFLLKISYQEVIILRYIEELSLNEISQIIKKSPVATRVLLHRANKALIREYDKAFSEN